MINSSVINLIMPSCLLKCLPIPDVYAQEIFDKVMHLNNMPVLSGE